MKMSSLPHRLVTRVLVAAIVVAATTAHAAPRAYITNGGSGTVSVIDTASDAVVATIPVGQGPTGVAINRAGTRAWVTNFTDSTVSVIDVATNTVVATPAVLSQPVGVAVNPAGTRVYVANLS